MPNKEGKETEEVTGPPDLFVGRDVLESYMKECNYKPINPLDRYGTLIKCITDGMELLPDYNDPNEKDEEQTKKNHEEQDKINILYKKASDALKTEIPHKRKIRYKYVDETHWVYELTANDADECEAVENDLEIVTNNFTTQQHEQHISKLQVVHNQIYHVLTREGIYPLINPTWDNLRSEMKKQFISEIMGQTDGEYGIAKEEEYVI